MSGPGPIRPEPGGPPPPAGPPQEDARDHRGLLTPVAPVRRFGAEPAGPGLTADERGRAAELALADPEVRRTVERGRHRVLGVYTAVAGRHRTHPLVVVYDYADGVAVEVTVDLAAGRVLEVATGRHPPALAEEEQRRARDLVRDSRLLAAAGVDIDSGAGQVLAEVDLHSPRYRHRLVDLRFGPADRRLPSAFAIVDLSDESVLTTGLTSSDGV
ncbi:hypothetical protein [Kitasatospora sp. DSM 101779]|uniref:hypothetical protein n=1 Tax=Kitasatospora sp. DSM 101779 TaxID=2853165 RepID=UPI0021DAFF59|nr:hypothetical protein [Kitasatospora sp. DSM 101779]MCU7820541.1 hypothetical protein [Kitasatospora sp. DSM 101779]